MNKKTYKTVLKKLKKLESYRGIIESDDEQSGIAESCIKLKADIISMIKYELNEFIPLLVSSGVIQVMCGDMHNDSFIVMDTDDFFISHDNHVVIISRDIILGGDNIPKDMVDWYSDKYAILPLNQNDNGTMR